MAEQNVPEDVSNALASHPSAGAAFEKLAPSHRREYLQWIDGAKQAATRQRRVQGMIERLTKA
jgi:uncharacterized protein YdeI (YjbR/CyaY-like superfamily)